MILWVLYTTNVRHVIINPHPKKFVRRYRMLKLEHGKVIYESDTFGKVVLDEAQVAAVELLTKKCIGEELHQNQ